MSKIKSISVTDANFKVLFSSHFDKENNTDKFISDLLKTIHSFGLEEFHNRLYRLYFSDTMIDLIWHRDYVFILTSSRDIALMQTHNRFLEELVYNLNHFEIIIDAIEYVKTEVRQYNFSKQIISENIDKEADLNISMAYVADISAVPIAHLKMDKELGDVMLIGPMLSAISMFSDTILKRELEIIQFGENKIFFRWTAEYLYIIVTQDNEVMEHYGPSRLNKINSLLENMSIQVDQLVDIEKRTNPQILNKIMFSIIKHETSSGRLYN